MRDIFHTNPKTNIRPEHGWLGSPILSFLGANLRPIFKGKLAVGFREAIWQMATELQVAK